MRTRIHTHGPTQGFTLIESLIAVTFLAVLFLAVAQSSSRASDAFDEGSADHALSTSTHRAIERIASAIELSNGTILAAPGLTTSVGTDAVTFQTPFEFVGATVTWRDMQIFTELQPGELDDDGIDNNGNGLIDERHVVLVQPEGRSILVSGVAKLLEGEIDNDSDDNDNDLTDETGLSFSSDGAGRVITVRLTRQRRDEAGRLLTKTAETAVRLLN